MVVLPPLGWGGRRDLLRVADAVVDCALPVGGGPHPTLEALALGTPFLTLAPGPRLAHSAARDGAAPPPPPPVNASSTLTPPPSSALGWRPAVSLVGAPRVEHGFAANFLRALFRDSPHRDTAAAAGRSSGSDNSSSISSGSSSGRRNRLGPSALAAGAARAQVRQRPSDAQVLAAMVVKVPAPYGGGGTPGGGNIEAAAADAAALGAAWVSAAAQLAEPGFRLAARRAVARRLEAWAQRSPDAAASGLADFVAKAVAAQRAQQRKGLAVY